MNAPAATRLRIVFVVAVAENGVIGLNNAMPWHLSSDLKRLKAITLGHPVIMGRKTYESIGRLLPGRRTVIVSRQPGFAVEGATVANSLERALTASGDAAEIFVIGGGEIYAMAMPHVDELWLTEVDAEFAADSQFPSWPMGKFLTYWEQPGQTQGLSADGQTPLDYRFVRYRKAG